MGYAGIGSRDPKQQSITPQLPNVLKDSLELFRTVRGLRFDGAEQIMLSSADINALYHCIQLERGMAALRFLMENHTSFNQTLKDLCLKLAAGALRIDKQLRNVTTNVCGSGVAWRTILPSSDWDSHMI